MKVIGFLGMSFLILNGIATGVLGVELEVGKDVAMFMQNTQLKFNKTQIISYDEFKDNLRTGCDSIGNWNSFDFEEQCPVLADWLRQKTPGLTKEVARCFAKLTIGLYEKCCGGGLIVCAECEIYNEYKFTTNGEKIQQYCKDFKRVKPCDPNTKPTKDGGACGDEFSTTTIGGGGASELKLSLLLIFATIAVSLPMF